MASRGWMEKRGEDTYRLCVSCGMDGEGNQIIKRKTFHGKPREAKRALTAYSNEMDRVYLTAGPKTTFEDLTVRWLEIHAQPNLAERTVADYSSQLKNYILPAIGHLRLEKLTAVHLADFYTNLQKNGARLDEKKGGLSPVTIRQLHRIVSSILSSAVAWGIIAQNVAKNIKPPRAEQKEMDVYDEEQTVKMLTALESEPIKYHCLISLSVMAGLRRGECLGLEWADIEENVVHIKRQAQSIKGKGIVTSTPKTRSGRRDITIPEELVDLLKRLKADQNQKRLKLGAKWHNTDRVFTTWNGATMNPGTISKWFAEFQVRAKLSHIRFHDLRHTSATLLLASGINVKAVSKRLGHAQGSTTINIYSHALLSTDQAASDSMQILIDRTRSKAEANQLPKASG